MPAATLSDCPAGMRDGVLHTPLAIRPLAPPPPASLRPATPFLQNGAAAAIAINACMHPETRARVCPIVSPFVRRRFILLCHSTVHVARSSKQPLQRAARFCRRPCLPPVAPCAMHHAHIASLELPLFACRLCSVVVSVAGSRPPRCCPQLYANVSPHCVVGLHWGWYCEKGLPLSLTSLPSSRCGCAERAAAAPHDPSRRQCMTGWPPSWW